MTSKEPPPEREDLLRENGALRAIITELLIVNQELRWQLAAAGKSTRLLPCAFCTTESVLLSGAQSA
jgi:hypothetical protein